MDLQKISDLDVSGKKVLVRADLDVGETLEAGDDIKLLTNKKTIDYLVEKKAKIVLCGHRGRPGGHVDGKLSLLEVANRLGKLINKDIDFIYDITGRELEEKIGTMEGGKIFCIENLRFDPREEANDETFSKRFSNIFDVYVNEAFSSSAKAHASIVGIPKLIPHGFGFHFQEEIENLSKVLESPKKPVVVIVSGIKEDKFDYVLPFSKFADKVLIAGRLPDFLKLEQVKLDPSIPLEKIMIADLIQDKEDITLHSVERFAEVIKTARTIVVGGPVGKYEDGGHQQGTKGVLEAVVANSNAFKVAGGGDTEQAIETLGLKDKFDWISVGGGAMLDYLAKGTLPGVEI